MRIAHIVTRMVRGGTERNVAHMVGWQRRAGHDVTVFAGANADLGLLGDGMMIREIPDLVREPSVHRDARAIRHLRRAFDTQLFDVIHTHQSKAGIVGRLAARPNMHAVVHTVHMPSFGPAYGSMSPALLAAERYCARRTDMLVTVGEELRRQYLAAGVGCPENYVVLRSPIKVEHLLRLRGLTADQRRERRAMFDVDPDRPTIVSVGALEPRKRHGLLISAIAPLLESNAINVLIAGDGPNRDRLETTIANTAGGEAVRMLGHVEAIDDVYAVADLLVQTSTTEGVPQTVVQALAAGVPVVATRTPGLDEVGAGAVFVARPDGADLTGAITSALERPTVLPDARSFKPWTAPYIEDRFIELHGVLSHIVDGKRKRPPARYPPT